MSGLRWATGECGGQDRSASIIVECGKSNADWCEQQICGRLNEVKTNADASIVECGCQNTQWSDADGEMRKPYRVPNAELKACSDGYIYFWHKLSSIHELSNTVTYEGRNRAVNMHDKSLTDYTPLASCGRTAVDANWHQYSYMAPPTFQRTRSHSFDFLSVTTRGLPLPTWGHSWPNLSLATKNVFVKIDHNGDRSRGTRVVHFLPQGRRYSSVTKYIARLAYTDMTSFSTEPSAYLGATRRRWPLWRYICKLISFCMFVAYSMYSSALAAY